MARTFIKICGITRVKDALFAAECGADAIGLVLHANSPRQIRFELARKIVRELPKSITAVGVFADAPAQTVSLLCGMVGIERAQLHGPEALDDLRLLDSLKLWRALPVTGMLHHHLQALKALMLLHPGTTIEALLLDTHDASIVGGTGKPNDWPAVREAIDQGWFARLPPLIVAGGLTPENVANVVRLIRPWGVDVSSGVEESTKGVKSHQKIEAFIQAVRAADQMT